MATLLYNLDLSVLAVNCICSYTGGTGVPFNCLNSNGEGDNIKAELRICVSKCSKSFPIWHSSEEAFKKLWNEAKERKSKHWKELDGVVYTVKHINLSL